MIYLANIDKIIVAVERQRKAFNPSKHQELCESIQYSAVGLQHPIVIRAEGNDPSTRKLFLVSGERRLRAMRDIYDLGGTVKFAGKPVPPACVPCVDVGQLSALERMEAELEENVVREDLTWQEKAAATTALWNLRNAQAEEAGTSPPTMAEFALEANPNITSESKGSGQGGVQDDLILSLHLDDPEVQAAKSKRDAMKVVKRKELRRQHEELGRVVGSTYSASKHQLVNAECLEWMANQLDDQFDIILTDPPYGMGADEFGDSGGKAAGEHGYKDDDTAFLNILASFPEDTFRLAKQNAHLYMFLDIDRFYYTKLRFVEAGWTVFRTPLIWYKPSAYRAPWPDKGPQRKYECILYAVKGDKKVNKLAGDVLTYSPDENLGHQAQKPVDLFVDLLSRSAAPGDRILDPFCGSGTIFPAASKLLCYATGVELDPVFYGLAAKRLGELE